ncbi:MAG: response regulator transcription factor [Nitrospiraceae bacterium]|nr:response regulator transcription factor [Nitrospiraceae bacterium]
MHDKKSTILVVEDERKISDVVKLYLEREGFIAIVAGSAEDAMRHLKQPPDLVVLDLMLPGLQGEDLCGMIRQNSDIPIIMLTAKTGEDDIIKGLSLGADDYVQKPFSPGELLARIKAQLRRHKRPYTKMSFNKGALTIDVLKREVARDGQPLTLTPSEFGILVSLSERPGMVLSRLQLVNMVQGYDFEGYERTIDAHVKNLRQKIEDDPKNPVFIKTIYGIGYKFIGVRDEE